MRSKFYEIKVKIFNVKTCSRAARGAGEDYPEPPSEGSGLIPPASLALRTYASTLKVKIKIKIKVKTRGG
jgi:hypothetical protein